MAKKSTRKVISILLPLGAALSILGLWELGVSILSVPVYILPPPSKIIRTFIEDLPSLMPHIAITTEEVLIGFILANVMAILVATIFYYSKTMERSFFPLLVAIKIAPGVAMAPMLFLWFGLGISSKVATVVLIGFFPMVVNTLRGLRAVDAEAADLFKSLSASKAQTFTKLRLHTAMPFIFSALKISASLSVTGALIGEFAGANKGIGYVIVVSGNHFDIVSMFSAVLAAVFIGLSLFWLVSYVEKRVVFWVEQTIDD